MTIQSEASNENNNMDDDPLKSNYEQDIIMPWSEPISDASNIPNDNEPRASTASRDSMGFMRYLEIHDDHQSKEIGFDDVFVPGRVSRRVVARAFHNILQAAGDGRLAVNQICPFGRITIMRTPFNIPIMNY